ncbi:hypothetical protein [Caenimonas soli]|uniref:hypothetical protein n=1 Tax=Caenimonas soli TaxID=2735555 RepID=UPI001551780C|nr:hypothetical protein [Caenimonas soli]NPC58419.1 hypothetical protein [Caenimonas soli]
MSETDDQENDKTTPPGRRSGTGSASVARFLVRSRATKPQVPVQPEDQQAPESDGEGKGGD